MKTERGTAGFTLLEVVVAFAIVGAVSVAVLSAVGGEIRAEARAQTAMTADALASDRLETLRLLPASELVRLPDSLAQGRFGEPHDNFTWSVRVEPVLGEPSLHRVRVEVENLNAMRDLETLLYRP